MDRQKIGRRIAHLRKRRGISSLEFSKMSGISQASISRVENGKQAVSVHGLVQYASLLKVHPFALLSDEPLWHSMLLPAPGAMRLDGPVRLLAWLIGEARERTGIPLEAAARRLGMGVGELEAVEFGFSLPSAEKLAAMSRLYGQSQDAWKLLWRIEMEQPALSVRLAELFQIAAGLSRFAAARHAPGGTDSGDWGRLLEMLEHGFSSARERRPGYYSLAHVSDRLFRCLQDGEFHALMERFVETWEAARKGGEVLSAPSGKINRAAERPAARLETEGAEAPVSEA